MTLQVAYVGTDGIVLASDMRVSHSRPEGPDHHSLTSKIYIAPDSRMALASSHADWAAQLARKIASDLRSDDLHHATLQAEDIAREYYSGILPDLHPAELHEADVIFTLADDLKQIYHLRLRANGQLVTCTTYMDKTVAGHETNSAVFFSERYYRPDKSVEVLAFLAAHVILSGNKLSPAGIEGLEIVLHRPGGLRRLTEMEIADLTKRSEALDEEIGRALLS